MCVIAFSLREIRWYLKATSEAEWKVGVIDLHVILQNYLCGEIIEFLRLRAAILFYFGTEVRHCSGAYHMKKTASRHGDSGVYAARVNRTSVGRRECREGSCGSTLKASKSYHRFIAF